MSVIVFAAPSMSGPSIPPVPQQFHRLSMSWTGTDGSFWPLTDWRTGVILLRDGLEGLHLAPVEDYTAESPGMHGQRYSGSRSQAQNVEWPIYLWSDTSEGWLEIERAWWKSFYPIGETGTWTVTTIGGESRRLQCRLTSDGGYAHTIDPQGFGWCRYPVSMIADDPFWLGQPVARSWQAPDPTPFFDPAGSPPLHISPQTSYADATMPNEGDVPAWPVWTFTGPATDTLVTVDGGQIGIPDLAAGDVLIFDTNPAKGQALLNGVNADNLIDPWDPRPIPPGSEVPVTVQMSQLAKLRCEITPAYYRAF